MGGADFCKFSHAFRHGLLLSERILQISPGKNDNLPLMATTSTVWGSGSIGLSLVAQSRPPQISLLCGFCPLAREFALRRTFQPPQSDFLQIPPRDGHPCLWLTVPATESVVDFHHQVVDHAGRTHKTLPPPGGGGRVFIFSSDSTAPQDLSESPRRQDTRSSAGLPCRRSPARPAAGSRL